MPQRRYFSQQDLTFIPPHVQRDQRNPAEALLQAQRHLLVLCRLISVLPSSLPWRFHQLCRWVRHPPRESPGWSRPNEVLQWDHREHQYLQTERRADSLQIWVHRNPSPHRSSHLQESSSCRQGYNQSDTLSSPDRDSASELADGQSISLQKVTHYWWKGPRAAQS